MSKFKIDEYIDKFICFEKADVKRYLDNKEFDLLTSLVKKIKNVGGEKSENSYICIPRNLDCANKIIDLLKNDVEKEIVAFIGRQGSGKDYQCNHLVKKHGFKKLAFADALRDIAFTIFDLDQEIAMKHYDILKSYYCVEFMDHDNEDNLWQHKQLNFRQILENLGTQGIRKYDNDFWCRCLIKDIRDNNYKKVCISDMRFLNEYNTLRAFAEENDYEFTVYFCDYRSSRYVEDNTHESAMMGNFFAEKGYKDMTKISLSDMDEYKKTINTKNKSK